MLARYEKRKDILDEKIWLAKWRNLKNDAHWHDEAEIIYCEQGLCTIYAEDEEIRLSAGESCLIEGGEIHRIQSDGDAVLITIMAEEELYQKIFKNKRLLHRKLTCRPDIPMFYESVRRELTEKKEQYLMMIQSFVLILLTRIYRQEVTVSASEYAENGKSQLLKEIMKQVELCYPFIQFQDICRMFNYSPSHFSRMFASLTGMTFSKYLTLVKIEHAIELIQAGEIKKISEIASMCGFTSIRNFNRSFSRMTGYTPKSLPSDYTLAESTTKIISNPYDPTKSSSKLVDSLHTEDSRPAAGTEPVPNT